MFVTRSYKNKIPDVVKVFCISFFISKERRKLNVITRKRLKL